MNRTYECMVLLDNREVKQGWEPLCDFLGLPGKIEWSEIGSVLQ